MSPMPAALLLLLPLLQPFDLAPAIRLYQTGEYQKAVDLLQAAPGGPGGDANLWLGKSYLRLRRWDDAIKAFGLAAKLTPDSGTPHLWLGRAYGEKASRASFLTAFGWARKAVAEFESAVKLSPADLDARFDLLEFYLQAPGIVGGGKDKAQAQAQAIAALSPRLGYTARARICQEDKKWDLGRAELVKATAEFPGDAGAFVDLAEFLIGRRDFAAAETNAARAVELDGDNANALLALAACRVELRQNLPAAEATLRRLSAGPVNESGPAFEDIYFRLGQALLAQSKRAEARQAFESALRFNPDHSGAKAALASVR